MDQKFHTWAHLNIECPNSIFLQLGSPPAHLCWPSLLDCQPVAAALIAIMVWLQVLWRPPSPPFWHAALAIWHAAYNLKKKKENLEKFHFLRV